MYLLSALYPGFKPQHAVTPCLWHSPVSPEGPSPASSYGCFITCLQAYSTLAKDMEKNSDEWEKWCVLEASEKAPMPGDWGKISDFRQLLIIRALKPGRITNALQVPAACMHSTTMSSIAEEQRATLLRPPVTFLTCSNAVNFC